MLPWSRERPQIVMMWVEWFRRLKWCPTGLEAFLLFYSTSRRYSRKFCPCLCYVDFFAQSEGYAVDDFSREMHGNQSLTLDCLGPETLLVF